MNRLYFLLCFTLCILLLNSFYATAADSFDPLQSGLRMMWGLGVVLALIFVIYLIAKKNIKSLQRQDKGLIKVLEVKHVLPKNTIILIEVRGNEYLVGAGNDNIGTIIPLKGERTFGAILESSANNVSGSSTEKV